MSINSFAYLIFHVVILISLFLGKLIYPKMKFVSKSEYIRSLPVILFFIVWDYLVTGKWWDFNPEFILPIHNIFRLRLPIEEILFFFIIPFALLTFVKNLSNIERFKNNDKDVYNDDIFNIEVFKQLSILIKGLLLLSAVYFLDLEKWYTFSVLILLFITDLSFLQRKVYFYGLLFTVLTTFIFNCYLTFLPVVRYTQVYKIGLRVGSIPIEDFGYGILLYLWIVKAAYVSKTTKNSKT